MNRRTFLQAGGTLGAAALAGCSSLISTQPAGNPPVIGDRPAAVYYPTHVEGMDMVGMGEGGDYRFGLMYSYPHRFWNVTGSDTTRTSIGSGDDVHIMASVWDGETMQVLPDTGLSLTIRRDGDIVFEEVVYPMLSQRMGTHYGANAGLAGDGSYEVTVSVGGMSTRRTGAFEGRFGEPASATIEFDYSQSARDGLSRELTPDRAGERAAVDPANMEMMPTGTAPDRDALPDVRGSATSGDAEFVVGTLDSPPAGIDAASTYLYVSPRTPYNQMTLPAMTVEAATGSFDGELTRTLDSELGYHYGTVVDSPGDSVTVTPTVPPQTARHEGYETAFLGFDPMEVSL